MIRCYGVSIVLILWAAGIVLGLDARATVVPFLVCEAIAFAAYVTEVKHRIRRDQDARERRRR